MATLRSARVPSQLCLRNATLGCYSRSRGHGFKLPLTPCLPALAKYYASKSFPPHTVISMPALSPTMTSGNIGTWQKKAGDSLAPGDVLVEIETDKAQMDFEFQEEGVLAKVLKESGEKDVAVGSPIAVMIEDSSDVSAFDSFTAEDAGGDKSPPKSDSKQEASEASEPPSEKTGTAPPKDEGSSSKSGIQAQESDSTGGKLETALSRSPKISPAAQKLALEKGVPIGQIEGSGPSGQITKSDIEKFKGAAPSASSAGGAAASYEDTPATSMRKTIGQRLTQSKNQSPDYWISSTCSVGKLLKLRAALNASAGGAYKLSVNDFLIKAVAVAAQKVPAVNSAWIEQGGQAIIRQHNVVDVSVAVATPVGLMTPIVKNVGGLGLIAISSQVKDFAKRAKDGKLKPDEYQGGTITISNMGSNSAVDRFSAIINPPQSAIIAVGTVKKVAVPIENNDIDGTDGLDWDEQLALTTSFDHKVVDGAVGAEFMAALKKVVENPLELIL